MTLSSNIALKEECRKDSSNFLQKTCEMKNYFLFSNVREAERRFRRSEYVYGFENLIVVSWSINSRESGYVRNEHNCMMED